MDINLTKQFIDNIFSDSVIKTLQEYIKIKAKSPAFDQDWEQNGYLQHACEMVEKWCQSLKINGLSTEIISSKGRTPLLFIEVASNSNNTETTLIYGHIDKQPEGSGWDKNKSPFKPVIENNKLYGRGSADDGYAAFSALCAIKAIKEQNLPHNRFVILIESGEESGSPDLPYYIEKYQEKIGNVDLVVCLDSGCGDYKRLWITNSLRGTAVGNLEVKILTQGIHSGHSGIAASSFRVLRNILDRIEDSNTGEIKIQELLPIIPANIMKMIKKSVKIIGQEVSNCIPFAPGVKPVSSDPLDLMINHTWKPVLSYIGVDGMPSTAHAGSVLRPETLISLSLRLPPNIKAEKALELMKTKLENNPPYSAKISFIPLDYANGWVMPELNKKLFNAINESSRAFFNNDVCFVGEGGSIPFMNFLLSKFPKAQFIVTGVLGPNSNAHGPNEFLHLPYVKNLTCALSYIFAS
jgi:acetylornithine deacetylase/succinyl-diaminopimelate desuccinylase-like protein